MPTELGVILLSDEICGTGAQGEQRAPSRCQPGLGSPPAEAINEELYDAIGTQIF